MGFQQIQIVRFQTGATNQNQVDSSMKTDDSLTLTILNLPSLYMQKMKVPRSRTDGVSSYTNNVYYIATNCGELDPKKIVCACPVK